MDLFAIEHSRLAYRADFAFYGVASLAMVGLVVQFSPSGHWPEILGLCVVGLLAWTLIEYGLHRFILHGVAPFSRWHGEHHLRPMALICSPTIFSASLILGLVFLPALLLGGLWRASALTAGILTGYTAYTVMHHATHHWRSQNAWFMQRRRSHARHHGMHLRQRTQGGCYGVTSSVWDRVFGSHHD